MNDNDLINNNFTNNTYKATRNLNTEIENPEMNINSAVGVNIQDLPTNNIPNNDTINNYFTSDLNQSNNQDNNNFQNTNNYNNFNNQNNTGNTTFINSSSNTFINQNLENQINNNYEENSYTTETSGYVPTDNTNNYTPTLKEKKKKERIGIPSELKVTIFIVLLLLLFISVMPYIFDFVKNIELTLMG